MVPRIAAFPIRRGRGAGSIQTLRTKLQLTAEALPDITRPVLYHPRFVEGSRQDPTSGMDKQTATKAFLRWTAGLPLDDLVVFTDGSHERLGLGYGWVIYRGGKQISTGNGKIDDCSVVYDAEVIGALRGLQEAVRRLPRHWLSEPVDERPTIWVCLDNTGAIWGHQATGTISAQWAFLDFHKLARDHNVRLKWSPGHCDIPGNEKADALAKIGAKNGQPDPEAYPTAYGIKSIARRQLRRLERAWWDKEKTRLSERYKQHNLDFTRTPSKALTALPRQLLHHYLAIRTGHGDFAWYHRRFNHPDAELRCACGRWKDPEHVIYCRRVDAQYNLWPNKPVPRPQGNQRLLYLDYLLSEPEAFLIFSEVTGFYKHSDLIPQSQGSDALSPPHI